MRRENHFGQLVQFGTCEGAKESLLSHLYIVLSIKKKMTYEYKTMIAPIATILSFQCLLLLN